eukprot:Pgem_evm1s14274
MFFQNFQTVTFLLVLGFSEKKYQAKANNVNYSCKATTDPSGAVANDQWCNTVCLNSQGQPNGNNNVCFYTPGKNTNRLWCQCLSTSITSSTSASHPTQTSDHSCTSIAPETVTKVVTTTYSTTATATATVTDHQCTSTSTSTPTSTSNNHRTTVATATATTTSSSTTDHASTTTTSTSSHTNTSGEYKVVKFQKGLPWANTAWGQDCSKDSTNDIKVVDVDMFDASNKTIQELKKTGHIVVCYISAGTVENWRPDVKADPAAWNAIKGENMADWNGETWIDITKFDQIKPLMQNRWNLAKAKGCDAIEADNIDCYNNKCVKNKTSKDLKSFQLTYNKWQTEISHKLGMSIGMKNCLGLVADLVEHYDFAVNEQCIQYNECQNLEPFYKAGKSIFGAEYSGGKSSVCSSNFISKYDMKVKYDSGNGWKNCFDNSMPKTEFYYAN